MLRPRYQNDHEDRSSQMNFVSYHSALRPFLELPDKTWAEFEQTGRIQWASDLAEIPRKFGVTNVYAELGTSFANSAVAHPKFCAALVGTLIKGMEVDHVMWGTDSVWYGSPQWQIEALRRLEIPEDMQKKYGFAPLGDANGATKQLIFGGNTTKFHKIRLKAADNTRMPAFSEDRLASLKNEYALAANKPRTCATATFAPRKCPTAAPGGVGKLRGRRRRAETNELDKMRLAECHLLDSKDVM